MIIFAVELSTVRASVAICEGSRVRAETSWLEPQARHQRLFEETPDLLARAGLDWPRIDLFAVGRGPGAFSGIRIGLMAAQMFAAPLAKKVVAVSSGEALALEIAGRGDAEAPGNVVVCGDARRGMFWYGIRGDRFGGWKLCTTGEFAGVLPADPIIATPHWQQTAPLRAVTPGHRWLEGDQYPTAHAVARLATLASEGGTAQALEPIYLHPPV